MQTHGNAQITHLQDRLARLELEFKKVKAQVGALIQQSQITSQNPLGGAATAVGLYAQLPSGQTLPAGTSNGMVMGSNANVVLCTQSGGTLTAASTAITVTNIAGSVTGPKALILLPMVDGTYSAIVAPC